MLTQIVCYQPNSLIGVVAAGGDPTGPAGVRENRGAGAACSTPCAVITVDRIERVADAIHAGRRVLHIARQSVLAGMGLSLAATGFAAGPKRSLYLLEKS